MSSEWPTKSLDELCESGILQLGRGNIISKRDIAADPGDYPIYSSAREKNGMFGRYGKYMFDEEMITWSIDGGGRLFYRDKHKFSVTNVGGTLRVLDSAVFDIRFLYYCLTYLHSQVRFDWVSKAHPSVIRKVYDAIPLPPLEEQKRIVAKLDEAMQDLSLAEILLSKKSQLTQAASQAAMESRMVSGRRTKGLPSVPLSAIAKWRGGLTPSTKQPLYWDHGDIPWLSSQDIKSKELNGSLRKVTPLALEETGLDLASKGSVAIVVRSGVLAHTFPVSYVPFDCVVNQDIKIGTPNEGVSGRYLAWLLQSSNDLILRKCRKEGATVQSIEVQRLMELEFPLPSLVEQEEIVEAMDEIKSHFENLRMSSNAQLLEWRSMRNGILSAAFAGEL